MASSRSKNKLLRRAWPYALALSLLWVPLAQASLYVHPPWNHHGTGRNIDQAQDPALGPELLATTISASSGCLSECLTGTRSRTQWSALIQALLWLAGAGGTGFAALGIRKHSQKYRQREQALRENEERYRTILESIEEGYFETDLAGNLTFFNESLCKILGYPRQELMGMNNRKYTTPNTAQKIYQTFNRMYKTREPVKMTEYEVVRKDGQVRVLELTASLMTDHWGQPAGFRGVVRDITERKQAEEELRRTTEALQALFRCSPAAIISMDREGRVTTWNPAAEHMFGWSEDEVLGRPFPLVPQEEEEQFRSFLKKAMQGQAFTDLMLRRQRKDGSLIPVRASTAPLRDAKGRITGLISVLLDITDTEQAQKALKESEAKYRLLVENANDAILIAQDGAIKFANRRTSELTGYSAEELSSMPFLNLIHPEDRNLVLERHQKRLKGEDLPHTYSFRAITKGGEELWAQINAVRITWLGKPATLNFVRDITPQKRLEAQLQHAQKMEAIGTLAGGIAHDFNNILQAISGYTQLLLIGRETPEARQRYLREIYKSVQRASELTKQLLTFSRKVESKPRPVNLNREVEQVCKLLARTIPKMISIEIHLDPDLKEINADPTQLEQIMMNLGSNARDAMPNGGKLIFETSNTFLDEEYCRTHLGAKPGEYVLLSISDTGHGMDKETLDHIFQPFYTTKGVGTGTGLGLAMVYGIVKSHEGYIMCYSEPGQGTTFKIYFPALKRKSMSAGRDRSPGHKIRTKRGHETILLVDDEDTLLKLGQDMLGHYGYRTIIAKNGEEALEIYRRQGQDIHLVILDLNMPGMGGHKCLQELLRIDPGAKVLIASGYSASGMSKETMRNGAAGFIGKPYNLQDMLRKVRDVLDRA